MSEARHQRHVPHVFQGSGKGNNNITKSVGKTHKLYTPGKRLIRQVTRHRKYYTGTEQNKKHVPAQKSWHIFFKFFLLFFLEKQRLCKVHFV